MAKPGSIAGHPVEILAPQALRAFPPKQPLDMPRQRVDARRRCLVSRRSWFARLATALWIAAVRLTLALATLALSAYGIREMYEVMATVGVTPLQWLFLGLFALTFVWISFSACQAVLGFLRIFLRSLWFWRKPDQTPPSIRTAVLVPVYNEEPSHVAAAVTVMAAGLAAKTPGRFDIFILSDTNRADNWIDEERVYSAITGAANPGCRIYYRHRRQNVERKAGNIADWVMCWGGGYDAMLVLDADSVMSPETMIRMARRLEADPSLGLIQTLPAIVRGRSLFARLQQFANRCYGPIFGNGLAAWHGAGSNYWGHNAIIRTCAFAEAARLPELSGKPPFGGHVLSHDFIEAAFLRRAGWGVRLDTDLVESFEEAPPSLIDVMVRDRRWCQGNLQHARFLLAGGLATTSRLHLLSGIMAYVSALLWFFLIVVGMLLAVQAAVTRPEYFAEPSLFPTWPIFDAERAIELFVVSMAVVLAPKFLGWLALMLNPRRCLQFGGPLALTSSVIIETLLSALYAPILMVTQSHTVWDVLTGRDSGWTPQRRRDGSLPVAAVFRRHLWHALVGAAAALLALLLNPDLFYWMLPVTGGLMLAPLLSWASGSTLLGDVLRVLFVLGTPEERPRHLPAVLQQFEAALPRPEEAPASALGLLSADPALCRWHQAQLENGNGARQRFSPALVLARAKAARTKDLADLERWLSPDEALALLNDERFIRKLHADRPVDSADRIYAWGGAAH